MAQGQQRAIEEKFRTPRHGTRFNESRKRNRKRQGKRGKGKREGSGGKQGRRNRDLLQRHWTVGQREKKEGDKKRRKRLRNIY